MDRYRAGSYPLDTANKANQRPEYWNYQGYQHELSGQGVKGVQTNTKNPSAYYSQGSKRASTPINSIEAQRKNQIRSKIQEIVKLCSEENGQIGNELEGVARAERQILNMLKQKNLGGRSVSQQNIYEVGDQERGTTFGPIRNNAFSASQANAHKEYNKYKKSAIDDLKTQRNNQEGGGPADDFGLQSQNLRQRLSGNPNVSDDALQMIEAIQKKAIEQIEALRQDKVSLMRKLNQEIRAHNEQKRLRLQLQAEVRRLRAALEQNGITMERQSQKKQKNMQTKPKAGRKASYGSYNQYANQNINMVNSPIHEHENQEDYERQLDNQHLVREIQSLQFENNQMKNLLIGSRATPSYNNQDKQSLVAELNALRAMIKQYQAQIEVLSRKQTKTNPQINLLLQQGQQLRSEAARIMHSKSSQGLTAEDKNNYLRQIEEYRKRLKGLQNENQQLSSGNHYRNYEPESTNQRSYDKKTSYDYNTQRNYSSIPGSSQKPRYSSHKISQYENLLGQIRRVNNM